MYQFFFILIKISLVIQRIKNPKNVYFIYCIIILSYIKYQSIKRKGTKIFHS